MTPRSTGWAFVGVQVLLLLVLVVLSSSPGDDWPTPSWLRAVSTLCTLGGLVVVVIASIQLGSALTPTPMPNQHGELRTSGLYGLVRHPVYSGVLLVVIGLAVRSASWVTAFVAVVTIAFFRVKAGWEGRHLAARYPGYPEYAATTGRFVPRRPPL